MKRRTKYNAKKTYVDGIKFDSKAEARRYGELKLLLKSGGISHLELQPRYDFIVNNVKLGFYKADFRYVDLASNKLIVEDVKGMKTPIYSLKKKLMKAIHGIEILETK